MVCVSVCVLRGFPASQLRRFAASQRRMPVTDDGQLLVHISSVHAFVGDTLPSSDFEAADMFSSNLAWSTRSWAKIRKWVKGKKEIKVTQFTGDVPDDIILLVVEILAATSKHGTIAALRFTSKHNYELVTKHLYKGMPFPDDVVLNIVEILKVNGKLRTVAALRSTSRHAYEVITPPLYRQVAFPNAVLGMISSLILLRPLLGNRHTLAATFKVLAQTDFTFKIHPSRRLRIAFSNVQGITLDSATIEKMANLLYSGTSPFSMPLRLVIEQIRDAGHEIMPALKHLTYRYDERDAGRTHLVVWYPGSNQTRYQWNAQSRLYDRVSLAEEVSRPYGRGPRQYAEQAQDIFKTEKLCVIPRAADLGPVLPRFQSTRLRDNNATCQFRAEFATVHNIHGKPCQLPNAKVVRVVFLADGASVTRDPTNQAVDYLGRPIQRKKRYDELLAIVQGMLVLLGNNVRKIVFVGLDRNVDPAAVSDITKGQFYHQLTKAVRRARQARNRRLAREGKPHGKLRIVMFDGKVNQGQQARRCGDCGSELTRPSYSPARCRNKIWAECYSGAVVRAYPFTPERLSGSDKDHMSRRSGKRRPYILSSEDDSWSPRSHDKVHTITNVSKYMYWSTVHGVASDAAPLCSFRNV